MRANSVLKIYISSTDKFNSDLLYEHIVTMARDAGLSGATVYRGIMGYGLSSHHINTSRFWELTEKLPVVIEIIDGTDKINDFYEKVEAELESHPKGCLITVSPIEVKLHKSGKK